MIKVIPGESALISTGEEHPILFVSDLHLGLEKELARKGFSVPSYTLKMLDRIRNMAEKYNVDRIVILGDVKHSVGKVEDIDWSIIPWFFDTLLDIFEVVDVVPGNHDGGLRPLLPSKVRLHPSQGTVIAGRRRIGVCHGHAWPSKDVIATGNMVIGHSHFTYEITDRFGKKSRESVWLFCSYKIDELMKKAGYESRKKGEGKIIIMPPFNRMVGGQPINSSSPLEFGPILSSGCIELDKSEVFLLDGTRVT